MAAGIRALATSSFRPRSLGVYLADGIYSGLRADRQRLCALVIVAVNARGDKHFLAIEDGIRESTQSWREVLLDLKTRGMNAPELAVGDGALGFWAALEEVFPATRQQRCWMHKTGNVLNAMPKSVQPKAKSALPRSGRPPPASMPSRLSISLSSPMKPGIRRRPTACSRIGNR